MSYKLEKNQASQADEVMGGKSKAGWNAGWKVMGQEREVSGEGMVLAVSFNGTDSQGEPIS